MTQKEQIKLLLETLLFVRQCPRLKRETLLIQKPKTRMVSMIAYIDEIFNKLGYKVVFTDVLGEVKK